jgi:hypothetical protein
VPPTAPTSSPGPVAALRRVVARAVVALGVLAAVLVGGFPGSPVGEVSAQESVLAPGVNGAGFALAVDDVGVDAELVGFSWTGGTAATLRVRALVGGAWTDWLTLEGSTSERPDTTSPEHQPGLVSAGPAWLGRDFRHIEVEIVEGSVTDLTLTAISSEPPSTDGPLVTASAGAVPAWPQNIIPRSAWGADESWRSFAPGCDGTPRMATDLRFAVVHHTVSTNTYAPSDSDELIRGIYYFHTHTNLWCDVGYHFFVDRYGQVFEGRAGGTWRTTIGGHAGGFNTGSTGVAVIGDFTSASPTAATYSALRNLLVWKLGYHGIDPLGSTVEVSGGGSARWPAGTVVTLPNLEGHRDSNSTGCPGEYLYRLLPQLRRDVAAGIAASPVEQRLTCDWDGDGVSSPAFYLGGTWTIRNAPSGEAAPNHVLTYGTSSYRAVCGDWDGNGTDTIGVYAGGWWYLRNSISAGPPDIAVHYGMSSYRPVVGDWDGNGTDTIGVYVGGAWYLRNSNTGGSPDLAFNYGGPYYQAVSGDWNGDGRDGIGVFDGAWYLRETASPGTPQQVVGAWGRATEQAVTGDYDDDGADSVGVARGAYWFLADLPRRATYRVFPF